MNKSAIKKWEEIRKLGAPRFALTRGSLIAGSIVCLVYSFFGARSGQGSFWEMLGFSFLPFMVGGYVYGHFLFKIKEKQYREDKLALGEEPEDLQA